jgi:hypothetical protein
MYVVGFNGPPQCGKDTLAALLADYMDTEGRVTKPVKQESLSLPLRHIAYAMVGESYSPATYEVFKVTPFAEFGCTGRQLMIDVSERFLKPIYAPTVMADLLLRRNADFPGVLLVRDMGFQIEADTIALHPSCEGFCLVQIHREDCGFQNDSRSYIHTPGDISLGVHNNSTLEVLAEEAAQIFQFLVDELGWKL